MGVHVLRRRTSYLATLSRFDDLVPLSFTEAPLACHHEGCPLMLLPIHLEFAWVFYLAVSMGGSNEFVECFCWGAVAEGGSGAVCHTPPRASVR